VSLLDEVKEIKEQYRNAILQLPNVCGIGVGYRIAAGDTTGELSIMVLVRQKIPAAGLTAEALAPQEVGGVRTDVLEVGDIRPQQSPTDRLRPALGGVSVGHYKVTAGTLGCVVRDRATGARLILSNNHILANINHASPGDAILQPGAADGGTVENDTFARLERFQPINFGTQPATCDLATAFVDAINLVTSLVGSSHQVGTFKANPNAANLVDAAIARPVDDADIKDEILGIGRVTGIQTAELGMSVRKSGRTTGLTGGRITVLDATVNVNYGAGRSATFDDQLVTGPMSQGGDSGSLLVAGDSNNAVGFLFAGSNESTIHHPIQAVLDSLEVDLMAHEESRYDKQDTIENAQRVKDAHQGQLMSKANVVGVGVGLRHMGGKRTEDVALVVMVSKKMPAAQLSADDLIPSKIDGIPVDVKEVGKIEAH
jgi:hypothetical protein